MNHNKWASDNVFAHINRLFHSWYLFFSGKICLGWSKGLWVKGFRMGLVYASKVYECMCCQPQHSVRLSLSLRQVALKHGPDWWVLLALRIAVTEFSWKTLFLIDSSQIWGLEHLPWLSLGLSAAESDEPSSFNTLRQGILNTSLLSVIKWSTVIIMKWMNKIMARREIVKFFLWKCLYSCL